MLAFLVLAYLDAGVFCHDAQSVEKPENLLIVLEP